MTASEATPKFNSQPILSTTMTSSNTSSASPAGVSSGAGTSTAAIDERVPSTGVIPLPHAISEGNDSSNSSPSSSSSSSPSSLSQQENIRNLLVKNVRFEHLAAGVSGGVISTLVCHPLDLIKVRFQVNEGHAMASPKVARPSYRGIVHAGLTIAKADGVSGLYAGIVPNLVGGGAAWGLYFLFYNAAKNFIKGDSNRPLTWTENMVCACQSGVITLGITNPIWVTKTRLCLQYERLRLKKIGQLPASSSSSVSYSAAAGVSRSVMTV